MDYRILGEKKSHFESNYYPHEAIIRKSQICDYCCKDINKGEKAIICYTYEQSDYNLTMTIKIKRYLHKECANEFALDNSIVYQVYE